MRVCMWYSAMDLCHVQRVFLPCAERDQVGTGLTLTDKGSLIDSTGVYTYVFLACSITVALSAFFLMVSFYWLDRRDTALKNVTSTQVSTVTPEALAVYEEEKGKESTIQAERISTV